MNLSRVLLLAKKEIKFTLKDIRVMSLIILSTLIFYPGLMIASSILENKQMDEVLSHNPVIALKGSNAGEFKEHHNVVPFNIHDKQASTKELKEGKVDGILYINKKEDSIEFRYEYIENKPKSFASTQIIDEWINSLEKSELYAYILEIEGEIEIGEYNLTLVLVWFHGHT